MPTFGEAVFTGHVHTLGTRCWCGHLTIPVSFLSRDSSGNVIWDGKGAQQYLRWLGSDEKPDYVNPPVMEEVLRKSVTKPPRVTKPRNEKANNVTKRPKSNAERQKAYRRRHGA